MNYYRIKSNGNEICFKSEEVFYDNVDVAKNAYCQGLLSSDNIMIEAYKISEKEYIEYLIDKLYNVFKEEYESFKHSLDGLSTDEICTKCGDISARENVMYILRDYDADYFNVEGLEYWLSRKDDAVEVICNKIIYMDHSDEMEYIENVLNTKIPALASEVCE